MLATPSVPWTQESGMLYLELCGLKAEKVIAGKMHESLIFSWVEEAFGSGVPVWTLEIHEALVDEVASWRQAVGDLQGGPAFPTVQLFSVSCLGLIVLLMNMKPEGGMKGQIL